MASSSTLSYLPREIRFKVYEAVAARPSGTKMVLQRWFEKKDVEEKIAQLQNIDSDTIYRVRYAPEDSSPDEDDEQHRHEEVDEEDDDEMEIDEDEDDENEDDSDDEDQDDEFDSEDQDDEFDSEEDDDSDDSDDSEENEDENDQDHDAENEEADDDDDEITESEDPDEVLISNEINTAIAFAATTGSETDATSAHQTQALHGVFIRAHRKWRHIPKFLCISHCPPPQELMLLSKDLAEEVREWFYRVAVVHINATASFAHTSMLDEVFLQIEKFPFSPFESIRNVQVSFVYDSQWARGPGCLGNGEFFEQILLMRAHKVVEFLKSKVPQLEKVEINWHDTVSDDWSAALKYDALGIFDLLPVDIEVKEHYLTPGKKPHRKSLLGKKRLEFQGIADHGFCMA